MLQLRSILLAIPHGGIVPRPGFPPHTHFPGSGCWLLRDSQDRPALVLLTVSPLLCRDHRKVVGWVLPWVCGRRSSAVTYRWVSYGYLCRSRKVVFGNHVVVSHSRHVEYRSMLMRLDENAYLEQSCVDACAEGICRLQRVDCLSSFRRRGPLQ